MSALSKGELLFNSAIKLAKAHGIINVTRSMICDDAGVGVGSFSFHTGMTFSEYVAHITPNLPKDALTRPLAKSRATKEQRKDAIMTCALELAEQEGYRNVTPIGLAEVAGVTRQCVIHYTGTKDQLRKAILRLATIQKNIPILSQAISDKEIKLPPELRAEVLQHLIKGQ
jgi:DNA-binding transcriptional regulator YbjK